MESKWPNTIRKRILFTGFTLCVVLVTRPTSAIEIHADPEVIVQNGTTGILRCTFKSSEVVSSVTTVTWYFQSSHPDSQFYKSPYVIFYFTSGRGFPGPEEFKDRVQFIGDINKRDVSIQLSPTYFSDNGTFFCDVKNPPDTRGMQARIELRVMLKDKHTTTPPPTSTPAGSTSITLPPSLSPPPLSVLLPIGSVYVVVLLVLLVLLVRRCVHRKLEADGEDDITSSITYSVVKASNHQQPPVKETRERETDSAVIYSAVRTEDIIYGQTTIRTRRPRYSWSGYDRRTPWIESK